jgi:type IV fimbrial biogenesis protein FimT
MDLHLYTSKRTARLGMSILFQKKIMKYRGFTLIELAITLTVIAVLSALAAPSFKSIIQNKRMTTQYNELLASLMLSRSEAINRAQRVTACQSTTGNSCGGTATSWHTGWVVFVDNDQDDVIDAGTDEIIQVHSALSGGNTLTFARTRVSYGSDALAIAASNGTFTLCDNRGDTNSKGLVVSITGQVRHTTNGLGACP